MLRHQLVTASALPPADPAAQASAMRAFERLLDEICERLEGKNPEPSADPALEKIRKLH
jgi:hypothetical protein